MNEPVKANFDFEGFKIPEFSYVSSSPDFQNLDLKLNPFGQYDENTGYYKLVLNFKAIGNDEGRDKEDVIKAVVESYFKFPNAPVLEDIPDYFYPNSIAIVFPYLRSFISSLLLQANVKLLILPLMNLNALSTVLTENTSLIKKQ